MNQSQRVRVECLPQYVERIFPRGIFRVAEERVPDCRHVHANLMCPARLEFAFDETIRITNDL